MTASNPDFTISGWPVESEAAREALHRMVHTHRVNPLPAYHINREIIHPVDYTMSLKGAVVGIEFILMHQEIPGNRQFFAARICRIDLLIPPTVAVSEVD
jgi:hypothetical protein